MKCEVMVLGKNEENRNAQINEHVAKVLFLIIFWAPLIKAQSAMQKSKLC